MSIGSLGFAGIGAATPLPQSMGADADRASQEVTAQKSKVQNDLQADQAAGIGETDGDNHEIENREGDGRLPWQLPANEQNVIAADSESNRATSSSSRDASGQCGNILDLTG